MRRLVSAIAVIAIAASASIAVAQPAAAPAAREALPPTPFLAGAYAAIWLAVLVYVVVVARKLTRVQGEIDDLRKRLDEQTRG